MAGVSGLGTTYDLPQLLGELFRVGRRPNAMLRAVGGLTGALRTIQASEFAIGTKYDLESPSQPAILEGADAPTANERTLTQEKNLVQIFQEAVKLSYSAQSNRQTLGGLAVIPGAGSGPLQDPASPAFQLEKRLEKIAQDANYTILRGAYQLPSDNTTARKSRGLRTAISTNVFANAGTPRNLTAAILEAGLKAMVVNGSMQLGDNLWIFADADQFENIIDLYKSQTAYPVSREVVGVQVRTIYTAWGGVNLVFEPDLAAGEFVIADLALTQLVAREIEDQGVRKGVLFSEPLGKVGAATTWQVYGEFGLDYGIEGRHALVDDLNA